MAVMQEQAGWQQALVVKQQQQQDQEQQQQQQQKIRQGRLARGVGWLQPRALAPVHPPLLLLLLLQVSRR